MPLTDFSIKNIAFVKGICSTFFFNFLVSTLPQPYPINSLSFKLLINTYLWIDLIITRA